MLKKYNSVKALTKSNSLVHTLAEMREKINIDTAQQIFIGVLISEFFIAKDDNITIASK